MGQMSKDLDKICDMKATLLKKIEADIESIDRMPMESVQGVATVVDMIHHLAEAEDACWEACYYKTVVKAMKEGYDVDPMWEDDEDDDMEHADTTRRSYPRTRVAIVVANGGKTAIATASTWRAASCSIPT